MAQRVRLEVFRPSEPAADAAGTVVLTGDALEEARLAAFEKGYRAGWDDAVAAAEDEAQRRRGDVARALQELSFTYHEARGHLLQGLGPLLDQLCASILPGTAHAALGGIVREAVLPLAEAALDRPLRLTLHPDARAAVEAALQDTVAPPLELVEDAALGPGQVFLRWDGGEERIDLDEATAAIRAAVTAFFQDSQEELRHHG